MGLDWGFSLKNKETKQSLSLISFCGWNSQHIMNRLFSFGKKCDDDGYEVSFEKPEREELFRFSEKLSKIDTILSGVSERKIMNSQFTKKQQEGLFDLYFDLGIEYDEIIIQTLRDLGTFLKFLSTSDLFYDWDEESKKWQLVMWKSW